MQVMLSLSAEAEGSWKLCTVSGYPKPLFQIGFEIPDSRLPVSGSARILPLCQFARRLVFINHVSNV